MPKSTIVGIAGGSASGKSTFSRKLADVLGADRSVEIFSIDQYYTRDTTAGPTFTSLSTGQVLFNYNHPDATDNARLTADLAARRDASDAPDVILIEGLMVLQIRSVRELLDLRLFVELDADERALRRLLRDMAGGRVSTDPQWIANYYLECARVGHSQFVEPSRVYADLIIRGDADFDRAARLVAGAVDRVNRFHI